jgi:hypothetical protein
VIVARTGTGQVLDVYCGMSGIPRYASDCFSNTRIIDVSYRCSGVMTIRDSDGGIITAFDWAESNWRAGTIGEYPIEKAQSGKEEEIKAVMSSRIYSILSWISRFLRL